MEKLRYYLAHNRGLEVVEGTNGAARSVGTFFEGHTLEHLLGSRSKPEIVFAAVAFDGGYRTRDAGKTWEKIIEGDVRTFSFDPQNENVMYMGVGPVRLFRSEDGGTKWEPLDGMLNVPSDVKKRWGPPAPLVGKFEAHVRHIFIHPDDSQLIFVLIEHGGVVLSRDGGKTWIDRSDGIDYVDVHMIENIPGSKERYFLSSAQGFYRSDDCGAYWRRSEHGMPWENDPENCYSHEWRFVRKNHPRMVVCGAKGSPGRWGFKDLPPEGHILLSDDVGASWRVVSHDLDKWVPWVLAPHPTDAKTLFCGMGTGGRGFFTDHSKRGDGALYVSRDEGASWEPLLRDQPSILTAWVAPP